MIIQTTTFWRDQNNLDVGMSFNRYQCRVQTGADDCLISFSVDNPENATIVLESGWMAICEYDESSVCAVSLYDLSILIRAIDNETTQMQLLPQTNPDAP